MEFFRWKINYSKDRPRYPPLHLSLTLVNYHQTLANFHQHPEIFIGLVKSFYRTAKNFFINFFFGSTPIFLNLCKISSNPYKFLSQFPSNPRLLLWGFRKFSSKPQNCPRRISECFISIFFFGFRLFFLVGLKFLSHLW